MASSSSSKPANFNQKLFIISLFLISFSLLIIVFSFKPQPPHFPDSPSLQTEPLPLTNKPKWLELIQEHVAGQKIKVGLVNVNNYIHDVHGTSAETVHIHFDRVPDDKRWGDFFPEWIDEDHKWHEPSCPEIPMPRLEEYRDLDVIVARVPCGGGDEKEGIRDVFRLQVNLVVANLAVESGRVNPDSDRTVYVVFVGSCGPMIEIFRCDDMVMHVGDYWVYKPELRRLKQKVIMPVGSCQISPGYAETGKEEWRYFLQTKLNYTAHYETEAYVTVLHSSEGYVCGAIALAQSIIQSNTKRDLVLLHDKSLSDKSIRGLLAAGWKTKLISRIRSPFSVKDSYNEWNYSKLRVWQLIEYEKETTGRCSTGDRAIFMLVKSFKVASYNGGDQGFLNEIFTWWHRLPSKINHLKVFRTLDNKDGNNDEHRIPKNLYAIHYLGLKPWLCYKEYDCNWDMVDHHIFASDSAHKKWWRIYDAMPKKLQKFCGLTKHMNSRIKKWRGIARNSSLINGHWKIRVRDPRQYHLVQ
ncbi:hypothetical protein Pint_19886 [Pistacia integerrima]|uniref:Uncharacterized protein n=1 Tax=Pistacia integerrima TaxID=434235 RepID=A0ACC0XB02_9ROSI|nr:hypothetical protein Pint_19886 [Pistacia integerrima]